MQLNLTVAALIAAVLTIFLIALPKRAVGGEPQLCHLEPVDTGWHYRTKIKPKPEAKCWYEGERMKPRKELYWAEAPVIAPPMEIPSVNIMAPEPEEGEFELRWKGENLTR